MNRDTLLIVDDAEINRAILRSLFEQDFNLIEAENGEQAIMLIKQYRDSLAAVLLDLVMPIKSGYEVMTEMTQSGLMAHIPVIVITSDESTENEVRAFDLGASDIIIKPFEPHVVRRRVKNAVELNRHKMHLEDMLEEQAAKLRESRDVIMDTLSSVIEHRSAETGQHVLRIRMFTKVLLEEVMRSCPEYDLSDRAIGVIAEAAALHDIGKISIPDTILNKPGRLGPEEFEIMKTHTIRGCEILSGLDRMGDREYLTYANNICRYHHERWDGKGYPDGLVGDNIPICAQVVGVADAYDALTTDRVYRKAIPTQKAITMILNGECGQFSPQLLECLKTVGKSFADLAHSYADGRVPNKLSELAKKTDAVKAGDNKNEPDAGHLKYFALLRYIESTVMEVDLDSGIYHLVYQQNEDFKDLRSSEIFEEAFSSFVENSVYPDDQPIVREMLGSYIEDFFGRGLLKRSRTYRVLHRASGEYAWYEATALRVNTSNPKDHKLLIAWKLIEPRPAGLDLTKSEIGAPTLQTLPVGVQQCLNDQWFTITYINEGFTSLFGYNERELRELFQGRYIELVHPDDRQAVRRQFLEQLGVSEMQVMEYRVRTKQGQTLWVLDKCLHVTGEDGREYLNCVLTDITQVKQAEEKLRLSMERYQIVLDQTNDIIFEWDFATDRISYSQNWEKQFGYEPVATSLEAQTVSHILPEDIAGLAELIETVSSGVPYGETEIRIAKADGRYLWCRIRATTQFDDSGKPVKAVGVILDIDDEKRQTQELATKAERDALTQLYNKAAAQEKIRQILSQSRDSDKFALILIDLDNFKQINDSRGHMFGDAVLTETAASLKSLFRADDVISRFGGDEFFVFLKYASDGAFLSEKAENIIEAFHNVYVNELQDCPLTSSIGIARFPEDGRDFQTLFQQCDQALYHAKQKGKNRYAFYESTTMTKIFGLDARQFRAAGTRIESDDSLGFSVDSLVPQAFRLLYESQDVETAINAILKMSGLKFNVSRAYIFEDSEDGSWCKNTFEWCNEGIKPEKDKLQRVNYADLGYDYRDHFNENGIFYCQDISKLSKRYCDLLASQGIRSMLQCAVKDGGKFVGFVGFDDCTLPRTWTQDQIDALSFISELLSTFLLKKRAQDRTGEAAKDLRMLLDNQNSWIYVIDPDTYVLRFINAKAIYTVPDAKTGKCCYEAFFHRDAPCERCPAKDIRKTINQTLEIYNPVLNIWSIADASLIRWGEQDACLLTCHDISEYK